MIKKPNNSKNNKYARCQSCGIRRHLTELLEFGGKFYCKRNGTPSCYMKEFLKVLEEKRNLAASKVSKEIKELDTHIRFKKPLKNIEQKMIFRKMRKEGFSDQEINKYLSEIEFEIMTAHEEERKKLQDKRSKITFKEGFEKLKKKK